MSKTQKINIGDKINTPDGQGIVLDINHYLGSIQHIGVRHYKLPVKYVTKFKNDTIYYFPLEVTPALA